MKTHIACVFSFVKKRLGNKKHENMHCFTIIHSFIISASTPDNLYFFPGVDIFIFLILFLVDTFRDFYVYKPRTMITLHDPKLGI